MLRSIIGLIASSFKKRDVYYVRHPRGVARVEKGLEGEPGDGTGNVSTSDEVEVGRRFLAKSTLDKTALSRIESRESSVP